MTSTNHDSPNDAQIAALYDDASSEHPPSTMDQAVLAAARQALKPQQAFSPFTRHWAIPVSLAAVIVISVSVITLIDYQSPESGLIVSNDSTEKRVELTARNHGAKTPAATAKTEMIDKDERPVITPATEEHKRDFTDAIKEQSTADQEQQNNSAAFAQVPDAPLKKQASAATQLAESEQDSSDFETRQKQKSLLGSSTHKPAPSQSETARDMSEPHNAASSALPAATAKTGEKSQQCRSLVLAQCLASLECTLALENHAYQCRQALDHCEQGFSQVTGKEAECRAKPGCVFTPGYCFCPPGVVCVCGGGPPRSCTMDQQKTR